MADDTMPAMTLAAGARVSKSLVLVRLLGRGGMGSVWVARHEGLDRDVAVKFVSDELRRSGDDTVLARFSREAKLAAKIDSPHVVRVFDHGETDDGVPFIVMELLRGESLAERLARDGRLAPRALADVVRQVARGLEDAHALGVVHRDIKPQNIFFASTADGTETVKIVDFGIAKSDAVTEATSSATSSGVIVGTPQYMSPEQLMRAGAPDRSADVWALAVVAYESLVGRPPFVGETLAATLVAITKSEIEAPSSAVPGLPGGLDAFFGRAFAPISERRYASPTALSEAFDAAVDTAPSTPSEAPPPLSARSMNELGTGEFLALAATKKSAVPLDLAETELGIERPPSADIDVRVAPPIAEGAAPRSTARRRWLVAGLALAVGGGVVYAITSAARSTDAPATPSAGPSAGPAAMGSSAAVVAPSASSAAGPSSASAASSTAPPPVPEIARTSVKDGLAPHSALFVSAFDFAREAGDTNATFHEAIDRCERKGLSLCTEAEWTRACEVAPELARQAAWTMTPATTGIVTRGGPSCDTRDTVSPFERSATRIAPCCSRVIGTTTAGANQAFLKTTAGKLLAFETTLDAGDASRFAAMSAPTVSFHGRDLAGEELAKAVAWVAKTSSLELDSCEVAIADRRNANDEIERTWIAECVGIQRTPTKLARVVRRITFGDGGLLEEVREPKSAAFY